MLSKLTAFLTLFLLSGCTLVPGGHVDVGLRTYDESYDISPKVNVRYITPALVKELEMSEPVAQINQALSEEVDKYNYIIGKGDILNITVWDHPELTTPAGQFRSAGESGNVVHSDGSIFYPYIGRVSVVNKSVEEVRDLIAAKLSRYIESPQVDVSVALYESQRVFVTGEVKVPALLPITNVPMTLLDALSLSGGMSAEADWRSVVLTSNSDGQIAKKEVLNLYALYQKGDMSQNRLLGNNDIVHVPRNDFLKVFVMGDVMDVAVQRIDRSGLTLAESLNNAGGINEATANAAGIFVLRASNEKDMLVDVFQLDASAGTMLILSTQFNLKPLDVVYVTSAPIARWNRVISQLIPTFNLLRYAKQADVGLDS
jgi:polysaccharide export outer membrane protein|tara:strand:+ start:3063 stop:4178 length:1116 start_codon:yes stop_codon:yes gene_type:complete